MGNGQSEFEQRFSQLYSFVQVVEDPHFQRVKIYRKNRFNFDYIMLLECSLEQLHPSSKTCAPNFIEQLQLIRKFQTSSTVNLEYFRLLENGPCTASRIRLYLEYFNYTLHDYIVALRAHQHPLTMKELIFVLYSLTEAQLALRKMQIAEFDVNLHSIFVSVDQGKVVLNPLQFLLTAYSLTNAKKTVVKTLSNQYQTLDQQQDNQQNQNCSRSKRSLSSHQSKWEEKMSKAQNITHGLLPGERRFNSPVLAMNPSNSTQNSIARQEQVRQPHISLERRQIQNVLKVLVELSQYVSRNYRQNYKFLFDKLSKKTSLIQFLQDLQEGEQLKVQQFGESTDQVKLYSVE